MAEYTQEQLAAIRAAIASGTLRVRYGSPPKEVEYRSLAEMIEIEQRISVALAGESGTARPIWNRVNIASDLQ